MDDKKDLMEAINELNPDNNNTQLEAGSGLAAQGTEESLSDESQSVSKPSYYTDNIYEGTSHGIESEKARKSREQYEITHNLGTNSAAKPKAEKRTASPSDAKKEKKGITAGPLCLIMAITIVLSVAGGSLMGSYRANKILAGEKGGESVVMYESVVRKVADIKQADSALSVEQVVALTENSVVEIRTEVISTGTFMSQYVSQGAGSGVVITEDGYIATNNHVIEDASKITVKMKNGDEYDAELVAADAEADLAVVKINTSGLLPVTFGDSSTITVGQTSVAIGNPLGELGGSVTSGIISALDREITIDNQAMTLLQTDTAVNPGNSGGGLFNLYGELIGIINAKSSGEAIEGLAFAIPANTAKTVISDLVEYGYVRGRVRLGITMVDINSDRAMNYYNVDEQGVYVYKVEQDSLADKAGIASGDRLVEINGKAVENSSGASVAIKSCTVGENIKVVVERNGLRKTFNIKATEYVPSSSN